MIYYAEYHVMVVYKQYHMGQVARCRRKVTYIVIQSPAKRPNEYAHRDDAAHCLECVSPK